MKTHPNEILVFHNPKLNADRRTVAHAQGLSKHVRSFAYEDASITETNWHSILDSLDRDPKEIMNKAHPYYQSHIRGNSFNRRGWLNILQNNADMIKAPIAIRGQRAILCETPTDIYKLIERRREPPV